MLYLFYDIPEKSRAAYMEYKSIESFVRLQEGVALTYVVSLDEGSLQSIDNPSLLNPVILLTPFVQFKNRTRTLLYYTSKLKGMLHVSVLAGVQYWYGEKKHSNNNKKPE